MGERSPNSFMRKYITVLVRVLHNAYAYAYHGSFAIALPVNTLFGMDRDIHVNLRFMFMVADIK